MSQTLQSTIGNDAWMHANAAKIRASLPEEWTTADQSLMLSIGFKLKLLGIDWRSEKEFGGCMVLLEKVGLMERRGSVAAEMIQIRRRSAGAIS